MPKTTRETPKTPPPGTVTCEYLIAASTRQEHACGWWPAYPYELAGGLGKITQTFCDEHAQSVRENNPTFVVTRASQ